MLVGRVLFLVSGFLGKLPAVSFLTKPSDVLLDMGPVFRGFDLEGEVSLTEHGLRTLLRGFDRSVVLPLDVPGMGVMPLTDLMDRSWVCRGLSP